MAGDTISERQIMDGPGLWDIMVSFLEGKEVDFKIKIKGSVPRALAFGFKERSIITGILQEDGSRRKFILQVVHPEHGGLYLFYYDVERRTGTVMGDQCLRVAPRKEIAVQG